MQGEMQNKIEHSNRVSLFLSDLMKGEADKEVFPHVDALDLSKFDLTDEQIGLIGKAFPYLTHLILYNRLLKLFKKGQVQAVGKALPHIIRLGLPATPLFKLKVNQIRFLGEIFSNVFSLNLFPGRLMNLKVDQIQAMAFAFSKVYDLNIANVYLAHALEADKMKALKNIFSGVARLNASKNGLDYQHPDKLKGLLSFFPNLTYLNLSKNSFGRWEKSQMEALEGLFTYLNHLVLGHSALDQLTPDKSEVLKSVFSNVKRLDLPYNKLYTYSADQLQLIQKIFINLVYLNLSYNELGKWEESHVALLKDIKLLSVTYLNLSHNNLVDWSKGVFKIVKDLISNVTQLNLSNNGLGNCSNDVIEGLKDFLSAVTHLALCDNSFGLWEADRIEALGILSKLISLNLAKNDLYTWGSDEFQALAKACPELITLDLSANFTSLENNSLKKSQIQALAKFSKLTTLYLAENHLYTLNEEKIEALGKACPDLLFLDMSQNHLYTLNEEKIEALGKAFPSLINIDISNNGLSKDQIKKFLRSFPNLKAVNLSGNGLNSWTDKEVEDFLLEFSGLQKITIEDKNLRKSIKNILTNKLFDQTSELTCLKLDIIDKPLENEMKLTGFQPEKKGHPGNLPSIINEMRGEDRYTNSSTLREAYKVPNYITSIIDKFRKSLSAEGYSYDQKLSSTAVTAEEMKAILKNNQAQHFKADASDEKAAEADKMEMEVVVTSSKLS